MRKTKKKSVDFLLNNKHYRRLHLILYFISISIIVLTYFLTILWFSKFVNLIVTSIVSFIVGLYIVLNRDRLVRKLSDITQERKRKKIKESNKTGLKSTLRKITPRNRNIKFNIKPKTTLKEKVKKISSKVNGSKKKTKKGYIEFK